MIGRLIRPSKIAKSPVTTCLKVGAKMTSVRMVQVGGTYRFPPTAQGSLPSISMGFVSYSTTDVPVQFSSLISNARGAVVGGTQRESVTDGVLGTRGQYITQIFRKTWGLIFFVQDQDEYGFL